MVAVHVVAVVAAVAAEVGDHVADWVAPLGSLMEKTRCLGRETVQGNGHENSSRRILGPLAM
jgi:hypothetical protein